MLNEWKARQAAQATPLREPAPQAVADRLAEVGAEVWSIALELANTRLAAERKALDKARADLEADRAEATELADRLAAQVEELQSRLASIEAAEQAARIEADDLRNQLAAAQEQAHTAEAKRLAQKRIEAEREAVPKDFKLMAQKREMKMGGWGEQWKAAPEPLRKLIDGYNATPKAQREAVLEQMMKNPKTREHVRELMAEQRQQYRANDRGMSL